jgi:lysophospholipase L1-like esterase
MHRFIFSTARAMLAAAALFSLPASQAAAPAWITTWAAAPDSEGPALASQTVRQEVRVSIGGARLRIRLSNAYGTAPLSIGAVKIGRAASPASVRPLLFNGSATLSIAPGADALSDALDFPVAPLDELAVSIHANTSSGPSTIHSDARQDAQITGAGTAASRYFLSEVLVEAPAGARAIVIVGDSISDGDGSTPNHNARWPDALAARLQTEPRLASVAVVNAGISGNRLLDAGPVGPSMLQRFERDALAKPGVRWILLEAGLNDIGLSGAIAGEPVSAGRIIEGLKELAARARARGIAVWAVTLTPYGGAQQPLRHNRLAEAKRQEVNAWIRSAGSFDRVIDFDAAVRDPQRPARMLPAYDSGDHVHPNDSGYRALAAAVPLQFFREK